MSHEDEFPKYVSTNAVHALRLSLVMPVSSQYAACKHIIYSALLRHILEN